MLLKKRIQSILFIATIIVVLILSIAGVFAILEISNNAEIKTALMKSLSIVGILTIGSIIIVSVTGIGKEKDSPPPSSL